MPRNSLKAGSAGRKVNRIHNSKRSATNSRCPNSAHQVGVYAWARTKSSANWCRVLRFKDRDRGDPMVAAANSQIRTATALCEFLEDHGFALPATEAGRKRARP